MARSSLAARVCAAVGLFFLVAVAGAGAADAQSGEGLLADIRQHDAGLAIWWTGHNGWLIKSNGVLIATDLVLDDRSRASPAPISATELAGELDLALVTHGHGDHFNQKRLRLVDLGGRIDIAP